MFLKCATLPKDDEVFFYSITDACRLDDFKTEDIYHFNFVISAFDYEKN